MLLLRWWHILDSSVHGVEDYAELKDRRGSLPVAEQLHNKGQAWRLFEEFKDEWQGFS